MAQKGDGLPGLLGIRHLIAFASGKGGVGRSTVLANLAAALAEAGLKVGLLDADVEDPGLLAIFGIQRRPEIENGEILPFEEYGLRAMALPFLLPDASFDPSRPAFEASLVQEGFQQVRWGELDYLLVELPPGQGRATRILAQAFPFTGIVLVMTPQLSAISSLTQTAGLFRRLEIPILGVIENMSFLLCPYCLKGIEVFGHGAGRMMSLRLKAPLLGEIPIDPALRLSGQQGELLVAEQPGSAIAEVFRRVGENLVEQVSGRTP